MFVVRTRVEYPFLPEDADDGEELEDVGVLEVGGEDLEQVVDVEAQRRHVVDDVHASEKKRERKKLIQSLIRICEHYLCEMLEFPTYHYRRGLFFSFVHGLLIPPV